MKKSFEKLGIAIAAVSFFGPIVTPTVTTVLADTVDVKNTKQQDLELSISVQKNNSYKDLYDSLSEDEQAEFHQIVAGAGLNDEQQISLLQDKVDAQRNSMLRGVKLDAVKAIAKYVAKVTGKSLASKPLKAFVNFLTNYEGKAEDGIRYALIHYLHFNSTAAYWTARTIVFLYL